MDIDLSALTFQEATKEDKKRISRLVNFRGMVWMICCIVGIIAVILAAYLLRRITLLTLFALGVAAIVLLITACRDMPAKTCKVCYGIATNKRESRNVENDILYYNAITFTSDKGEVIEDFPVFSKKTWQLLSEGSRAVIVCYNERPAVIFAEEQVHPAK